MCGDGEWEGEEACDDGNALGGDGCSVDCTVEDGPLESEPNDSWDAGNPLPSEPVSGNLPEADIDCFTFDVSSCEAVSAALVGDCPPHAALSLHRFDGALVATGTVGAQGCPVLDPEVAPGARLLPEGPAAVCVQPLLDRPVPVYQLEVQRLSSDGFVTGAEPDLDGDGTPDVCDVDRDGDGVLDEDDNCPDVSNGPKSPPPAPNDDGFLVDWLALAPIVGQPSTDGCRPSDTELTGGDDLLAPSLGDVEGALTWVIHTSTRDRMGFLGNWGGAATPREVYLHTYVFSKTKQSVTLALGPDDGVRAWLNGVVTHDEAGCQGTTEDEFQTRTSLIAGWNRLTVKVRDQGGGWGLFARFRDDDGNGITDLEISLSPDGTWSDDQGDLDGDGIGDACDPDPSNP
ncbi:MAG: thrombospondin type 3 repeat-containing protein [Myxococcales bacterium]|nr:thrombospondin type 3 repeat-containing protein [Myxococcales bacterium]